MLTRKHVPIPGQAVRKARYRYSIANVMASGPQCNVKATAHVKALDWVIACSETERQAYWIDLWTNRTSRSDIAHVWGAELSRPEGA